MPGDSPGLVAMAQLTQDQLGELLSAYLDGELAPREHAYVEHLLRENRDARRLLEELRRTVYMVAGLPCHAAPPNILDDVKAQIERRALLGTPDEPEVVPMAKRRRIPWVSALSAAAALALAVTAGLWYWNGSVTRDQKLASKSGAMETPPEGESSFAMSERMADAGNATRSAMPSGGARFEAVQPYPEARPLTPKTRPAESPEEFVAALQAEILASASDRAVNDKAAPASRAFEREPVRMRITTRSRAQRSALLSHMLEELRRNDFGAIEGLTDTRGETANTVMAPPPVVRRRAADANDRGGPEDQIFVRIPVRLLAALLDSALLGSDIKVALAAGPVEITGLEETRTVLAQVIPASALVDSATDDLPAPVIAPGGGLFGALLRVVGIDLAMLPTTSVVTDADAADDENETAVSSVAFESGERVPLVERRAKALAAARKETAAPVSNAGSTEAARFSSARSTMHDSREDLPGAMRPRAPVPFASEPYITLVIQLSVEGESAPPARGAATPPAPRNSEKDSGPPASR